MALRTRPDHQPATDPDKGMTTVNRPGASTIWAVALPRIGRALLAAAIPLAGVLLPGTPAAAAPDTSLTWSVRPTPTEKSPQRPNFAHDLAPGQRIEDSIRVRNFGNKPLPLTIYSSDALNTSSGALDLLPAATPPSDVGKWIVLGKAAIEVPANGHVDVPFTMVVPSAAEPGDHTGGIVTSYRAPGTDDKGRAVIIDRRLGTRMYVRVAGALRPELTVSEVRTEYKGNTNPLEPGDVRVSYTVTNTGNVRIGAEQTIVVPGGLGLPGIEATLDPMPELLPGNSLDYSMLVPGIWPTFRTTATVELRPTPSRQGEELDPAVPDSLGSAAD